MATETIGKYQLHLIAYELPGSGQWEPYLTIDKFDDEIQDFKCVVEKYRVSDDSFGSYAEAIEEARRVGNALIKAGNA
jgi:hypothetical protein